MNKIITNKEMNYIRIERDDIVFQQDKIYPDVIDAIEELKEENKRLKEVIETLKETNKLLLQQKGQLQEDFDMLNKRIDEVTKRMEEIRNNAIKYEAYHDAEIFSELIETLNF